MPLTLLLVRVLAGLDLVPRLDGGRHQEEEDDVGHQVHPRRYQEHRPPRAQGLLRKRVGGRKAELCTLGEVQWC